MPFFDRGRVVAPGGDYNLIPIGDSRSAHHWATSGGTGNSEPGALTRGPCHWIEALHGGVRVEYRYGQGVSGDRVEDVWYRIKNNVKNAAGYGPDDVPRGCIWYFLIGTNNASSATKKVDMEIAAKVHQLCVDWMLQRGDRVIVVSEWPRSGLTGSQPTWFVRYAQRLRTQYANVRGVEVVDPWVSAADPTSTTGAAITGMLDADELHGSPGIAFAAALPAVSALERFGIPKLNRKVATAADVYDATNNPEGCLNTNPALAGSAGTVGANAAGVAPDGYTLATNSAALTVTGSRESITVAGVLRDTFKVVCTGLATVANSYVQLRQSGLQSKVIRGDVLEAGYHCFVGPGHGNFAGPGLLIDPGVSADRAHGLLSQSGDSSRPAASAIEFEAQPRSVRYTVPRALPSSLALDLRPYFTSAGSTTSTVTLYFVSAWMRKV